MKFKYMHTLNGCPAYFEPDEKQIFYATSSNRGAVRLVSSIKEIHRNEKVSLRTRFKAYGETAKNYGWAKVAV